MVLSSVFSPEVSTIVVILASILFWLYKRNQKTEHDPYEIKRCPYPDCIRCTRYAEVNESAQRRLPWVLWGTRKQYPDKDEASLEKELEVVFDAVSKGPHHNYKRRQSTVAPVAPTFGQYPTVLLVPGLTAEPLMTHLHENQACKAVRNGGKPLQQQMLDEFLASRENKSTTENHSSNSCKKKYEWLSNEVGEKGEWEVLHILNQGLWNTANMKACPHTTAFVQGLPGLIEGCIFGNAFISVLHPGTTIEPHCGPSNVRHRLHFSLQIPKRTGQEEQKEPVLTVAGVRQTWKSGDCFVFDDSLTHSVTYPESSQANEESSCSTSEVRVVLIVDLWHPDLTEVQRAAIIQLYAPTAS